MSQEGLQKRRKCKRVAVGKRQSLESHYLFNYMLDILENMETRLKQDKKLKESGDYIVQLSSLLAEMV